MAGGLGFGADGRAQYGGGVMDAVFTMFGFRGREIAWLRGVVRCRMSKLP